MNDGLDDLRVRRKTIYDREREQARTRIENSLLRGSARDGRIAGAEDFIREGMRAYFTDVDPALLADLLNFMLAEYHTIRAERGLYPVTDLKLWERRTLVWPLLDPSVA